MHDEPLPQPTDDDERLALRFLRTRDDNALAPADDEDGCRLCFHYLDASEPMSYCWHPRIRMGVSADWRCRWWRHNPDVLARTSSPDV